MRLHNHLLFLLNLSSGLCLANPFQPQSRRRNEKLTEEMVLEAMGQGPEECEDFLNPSEACQKAMTASLEQEDDKFVGVAGIGLKYAWDSGCEAVDKKKLARAAYDAYLISASAIEDVSNEEMTPIWNTWMGPNHQDFKGRIIGNLGRIADFKQNYKYDIWMACDDPHDLCNQVIDGRPLMVGGYAWTYKGWFGYKYSYINLCDVYFGLDMLTTKIAEIGKNMERGDDSWAKQAVWQKNMGQYFLHEMMHLDITSRDSPHINDEYVDPQGVGGAAKAYGPSMVYKLAQRPIGQGGGAERASTNADSYAWFANSVYFYNQFAEYPLPPKYKSSSADAAGPDVSDDLTDDGPVVLHLGDFSSDEYVTEEAFKERVNEALQGFNTEPESDDEADEPDSNQGTNPPKSPQCYGDGDDRMPEESAKALIDDFCGGISDMNETLIGPPIFVGTDPTDDGRNKGLGAYDRGSILEGTNATVWSGVTFAQDNCLGNFMIATGEKDEDEANCKNHLQTILSGCDGAGGTLRDSCELWYLRLSANSPMDEFWKDPGEVECGDMCSDDECRETLEDSPLADACICWHSNYDTVTAQFNRPDSGICDADEVDLKTEFSG